MTEPFATIAELWRYPVKGMRGERVDQLTVDAHGIVGDRRYAVVSSGAPRGKPLLTGTERAAMLLYTAAGLGRDTTVTTPQGEQFSVQDPALLRSLQATLPGGHSLSVLESETPLTDVRPIAIGSSGTVAQLSRELGRDVDPRRFRSNILFNLQDGFAEDALPGKDVRLGDTVVLHVTERVPRCRIVTLDPDTAAAEPALMKHLDRHHNGRVGVYATVVRTGLIRVGDAVTLL